MCLDCFEHLAIEIGSANQKSNIGKYYCKTGEIMINSKT